MDERERERYHPPSLESVLSPVWDLGIILRQPDLAATAFSRSLPTATVLFLEADEDPQAKEDGS